LLLNYNYVSLHTILNEEELEGCSLQCRLMTIRQRAAKQCQNVSDLIQHRRRGWGNSRFLVGQLSNFSEDSISVVSGEKCRKDTPTLGDLLCCTCMLYLSTGSLQFSARLPSIFLPVVFLKALFSVLYFLSCRPRLILPHSALSSPHFLLTITFVQMILNFFLVPSSQL